MNNLEELKLRLAVAEIELAEAKVGEASGKIQLNGTFGKLGSCFSKIYAPDLLIATTLTGQFYLLSVIEVITEIGVKILSANTDGITFGGTPELVAKAKAFIDMYGWATNFEFEYTCYRSISMKDCNNYIAVKTNGDVKAKGLYAKSGLQKNPTNEVCGLAAAECLAKGTPIKEFVLRHFSIDNFTDFLQVRTVKGGAVEFGSMVEVDDWVEVADRTWVKGNDAAKEFEAHGLAGVAAVSRKSRPAPYLMGVDPKFLGRVARWYYSTDPACEYGLRYASNNNLVPKSTGGRSCMKLPETLPADVDVQRYIDEAVSHLGNMGVYNVSA